MVPRVEGPKEYAKGGKVVQGTAKPKRIVFGAAIYLHFGPALFILFYFKTC